MNMSLPNSRSDVLKLSLKYTIALVVVLATALTTWLSAQAQQSIPAGSYQQSCVNISVNGNTLAADCGTMNGSWNSTKLGNFPSCASEIWNMDGNLTCLPRGIPSGSYLGSCTNISSTGITLYAMCKKRSGDWWNTSLMNFRECSGDINNQDGILTCPKRSASYSGRPSISFDLERRILTGSGFLANTLVYIRVVSLSGLGYYPQIFSDSSGNINVTLNFTCFRGYRVGISANDDRWDSSRNDHLWSNVVEFWCP